MGKLPIHEQPFQCWDMDFVGPLLKTPRGNGLIYSLTDPLSEWVEAYPVPDQTAKTPAEVLSRENVCRYGILEVLHSHPDRNCYCLKNYTPAWISDEVAVPRTILCSMGKCIGMSLSPAMEIEAEYQTNWNEKLHIALAEIRTTSCTTTGETPFSVIFGFTCRKEAHINGTGKISQLKEKEATAFSTTLSYLRQLHMKVQNWIVQKCRHESLLPERNVRFSRFTLGEKVWIYNPKKPKGTAKKLVGEGFQGP